MTFDYTSSFYIGGYWATKVADRLQDSGINCYAPPINIAQNNQEREHMTLHEQDIVLSWTHHPIEVKSSSRDFTENIIDYPYETLFVDTVHGYDSKKIKPLAYVIVSQKSDAMVCISPRSSNNWERVNRFDHQREISDWFYSAPKSSLIPFNALVEHLQVQQKEATI